MKKILFVRTRPLESDTSSSIRAISTVDMLAKCGYEVTVLTTNAGLKENQYKIYSGVSRTVRILMSVSYEFLRQVNSPSNKSSKKFIASILSGAKRQYRKFKIVDPLSSAVGKLYSVKGQLERKYELIVSCSDPKSSHLLAQEVIKNGIQYEKFIEFWGDPLLIDISRKYYLPKFFVRKTELKLMKSADKIFYVSPYTMKEQMKIFPEKSSYMDCVFPAYQIERVSTPVKKLKRIGYFGDYYSYIRNILPLYEVVKKAGYVMEIYGQSDITLLSTDYITISGRIPSEQVTLKEKESDLLVCICNSFGTQIPGKLYQYAATNKPILVINDGDLDLNECFGKYKRFVFAENDEASISTALENISKMDFLACNPLYEFSVEGQIEGLKSKLQ